MVTFRAINLNWKYLMRVWLQIIIIFKQNYFCFLVKGRPQIQAALALSKHLAELPVIFSLSGNKCSLWDCFFITASSLLPSDTTVHRPFPLCKLFARVLFPGEVGSASLSCNSIPTFMADFYITSENCLFFLYVQFLQYVKRWLARENNSHFCW